MAEDVNKSVQHAGKGAMTLSINKGVLRQQEEMTIDSERVPGYFDEIRANNHSIANAVQGTAFGEMSEFPPMIPVVIRGQSKGMFKQFLSDSDDSLIEHINPEIIIYERK